MRMMTKGMKVTQSLAVRRSVRTSLGFRIDPCSPKTATSPHGGEGGGGGGEVTRK